MPQDTTAASPTPQPQAAPSEAAGALLAHVQALGARLQVRQRGKGRGRLCGSPASAYSQLTEAERATLREHREELRALVLAGYVPPAEPLAPPAPPPMPAPEGEHVVFVYGIRVSDAHVRLSMANLGDQALADYLSGKTSKAVAYAMTRAALAQSMEIRSAYR
jgi:hypothetical protein